MVVATSGKNSAATNKNLHSKKGSIKNAQQQQVMQMVP